VDPKKQERFLLFGNSALMISLTKIEPRILFPRPNFAIDEHTPETFEYKWDRPDIKRNPKFWLKLYLEGLTLHRRSFALAARADNVLDLGCGSGWFSIALAQRRSGVSIDAVDKDGRLLDWGRYYMDRLKAEGNGVGKVRFSEADIDEFPWQDYEEKFDLVHAGFILSRLNNPSEALNGIYKSLKPGGWLIYHDATDPPSRNLNRLARMQHYMDHWKDASSDPWAWRRVWERRYRYDVVRAKARTSEPEEKEVIRRLEELFAMRFHDRRRPTLDLFLSVYKADSTKWALLLPLFKFCDDFCCWSNLLVGGTRYVLGQKR
jgi:SAM-dependent methyltransferase